MRKLVTVIMVAALGLVACAPRLIPGTTITDTKDNQAILDVVRKYRAAYEARDVEGVMALVSPRFFETNGTADASDDYDFHGLKKILTDEFARVSDPSLDLDVRKVKVSKDGKDGAVDYYFSARFQLADAGANGGFKSASDVAQMKLVRDTDGTWKIVSGI